MKYAIRTSRLARIRWWAEGMSDSFPLRLPRRTDRHHSVQIVGQNAESNPRIRAIPASQTTVSPLVLATAQADRGFLPTSPPLLSPEPPLTFKRQPGCAEPSFIRQADLLDAGLTQQRLVVLAAKAAVGGDDLRCPRDCLSMSRQGRGQEAAIFRIPHVDLVMRDHTILGLRG